MFFCCLSEVKPPASSKDTQDLDDLTVLKSLADGQKPKEGADLPLKKEEEQYVPDEADSTKSRRLVEDYDSTKNGMDDGKYRREGASVSGPPFPHTAGFHLWVAGV